VRAGHQSTSSRALDCRTWAIRPVTLSNPISIRHTVSQFVLRALYRLILVIKWKVLDIWTSTGDNYHVFRGRRSVFNCDGAIG
jgi:hypothetical protein